MQARKALFLAGLLLVAGLAVAVAQSEPVATVTSQNVTEATSSEAATSNESSSNESMTSENTTMANPNGTAVSTTSTTTSSSKDENSSSQSAVSNSKDNSTSTVVVNPDGSETTIITTTTTTEGSDSSSSSSSSSVNQVSTTTTVITTVSNTTAPPVSLPVTESEVKQGDCSNGINMCFAIDSSGSLTQEQFQQEIEWARSMGRTIDQQTGEKSRLGAAQFGTAVVNLTEIPSDYPVFDGSLNKAEWGTITEATNIGGGVSACAEQLIALNQNRPSFLFLLTDGNPNIASPDGVLDPAAYAFISAEGAKQAGIYVLTIAIQGITGLNSTLLQLMASTNEKGPLYFPIGSTNDLPATVDKLVDFLCNYTGGEVEGQDTELNTDQLQTINEIIQQTVESTNTSSTTNSSNSYINNSYNQYVTQVNQAQEKQVDETAGTGQVCGVEPKCRMYVEDVVCCRDTNELTTSRVSTYVTIMCTDPVKPIDSSCIMVDGPDNVTVSDVYTGANTCGGTDYMRYMINWGYAEYRVELTSFSNTRWNGTMTIDAMGGMYDAPDMCTFQLAQPCGFEGQAYYNITDIETIKLTVNNEDQKLYNFVNYMETPTDLNVLDSMSWVDPANPAQCKTQLSTWLPSEFYQQGTWLNYNEGFRYECNRSDRTEEEVVVEAEANAGGR